MTQLDFCQEHDEQVIAHTRALEPVTIPSVGECAFVPDERDSLVYICVRVSERNFYYDQQGQLATVRLTCDVLFSGERERPRQEELTLNNSPALVRRTKAQKSLAVVCCPRCANALMLHQPDPGLPDRILATCDECKSWYLSNPGGTELCPLLQPQNGHGRS